MNISSRSSSSLRSLLLARAGGWYPILVVALAQLVTSPLGILLAAIPSRANAEFTSGQTTTLALLGGIAMLVRNIGLLALVYLTNRQAIRRLRECLGRIPPEAEAVTELAAWRQITSLSWRYIFAALATLILFALLPVLSYMRFMLGMSADQMIYVALAALAAGIGLAVLEILIIEAMLSPAREILVPRRFESQTGGVYGLRLLPRFLVVVFGLIAVAILLVAPVGYHQTMVALSEGADPVQILISLRLQLIVASVGALLLGLALSYSLAKSLSTPIGHMINVLGKAEAGDLAQRIRTIATDEIGELALHFNRMVATLERLQTNLEEQVRSRTEQLDATLEVGRVANAILNPDELVSNIVSLITNRFGYYYAAIYLVDASGRWAELKDATGVAGQAQKESGHKLEVGGRSLISSALTARRAIIGLDVGPEAVRFSDPLLPETRSEIVLPLMAGERAIGVLDVHSKNQAAFGEKDAETLQGMANQVAVAFENARRFQETQRNLEELRSTHRMYLSEAWSETAREHGSYEYVSGTEVPADGHTAAIDVPLALRDQIIGSLSLEGQQDWTPEERTLIEAVATQAALALENARLLDESRQMALRERLAAEITGKVWSSPNVEFILQTAVKELGRALRADEATIELKTD